MVCLVIHFNEGGVLIKIQQVLTQISRIGINNKYNPNNTHPLFQQTPLTICLSII